MARSSCMRIFISITVILLLIASYWYFFALIPYRIAASHEEQYFSKLYEPSTHHPPYDRSSTSDPQNEIAAQHNVPLQPLVHNVLQLSSAYWETDLSLYMDGTAKYPMQRRWVYVAGTPKMPRSLREKFSRFSPPNKGSCVDSPSVCSDFNAAFDTLAEQSRGPKDADHIRTSLTFFDCDNSPILCDVFRIAPVMLLHLETKPPCFVKKNYSFVCSTRWTYISLPLKKMPFQRKVWINGLLVPAFPSALEQLRSLMLWDGGLNRLRLEEYVFRDTSIKNLKDGFTFEGVSRGDSLYDIKLREVAEFLAMALGERGHP